jgi:hypothetical protein
MDFQMMGKILLFLGLGLAFLGGLILLLGRFVNIGSLPGDLRFNSGNFSCLVPIGSMILLSIILTVVVNLILRFINR